MPVGKCQEDIATQGLPPQERSGKQRQGVKDQGQNDELDARAAVLATWVRQARGYMQQFKQHSTAGLE